MENRTSPPSPTNKYLIGGRYLNSSVIFQITHNGFGLGEGGDFNHKTSYEAPNFKFMKNCHTKQ